MIARGIAGRIALAAVVSAAVGLVILAAGVLEHVRRNPVDLGRGRVIELTLSAGVAQWREDETPQSLFRRADENLYRAKTAGRNRLVADEGL